MIRGKLIILLVLSFVVRALVATFTELGNDEVYYRIFGLFPDWSYFDHPPMVAWLVRLTTFGAEVVPEFFVRLASVVIGTLNTYIIYRIAGGGKAGFAAGLLYTGSIYASVILGTFIMPDTPLSLFWLLSLWIFSRILVEEPTAKNGRLMLVAGVLVGLAMLSKYTGAYLWAAAGLFVIIYNRKWMIRWELWTAVAISCLFLMPVVVWNFQNGWISFTFHSARVVAEDSFNWLYLGRELMGGVFYNNPVNFVLIIGALFGAARSSEKSLLMIFSLPMIILFLGISLTRETLPHWAAPAYFALIILAAKWLKTLRWAYLSVGLTAFVLILGFVQIQTGAIDVGGKKGGIDIGRGDFSLDMYGWRYGGERFAELHNQYVAAGLMPANATLLQYGWDDAAHIDTYFGLPIGLQTKTMADTAATHYYEWINRRRGGFIEGQDFYLISPSRYFFSAEELYSNKFGFISNADTIKIYRRGEHVSSFYVYRLKGLQTKDYGENSNYER